MQYTDSQFIVNAILQLNMEEDNYVNEIIELYKKNEWRVIVEKYHDHVERNKLLWVFPSVDNFKFLNETLRGLGCESVVSVGCGSGLLEWMIIQATGLSVQGLEIDGAWWHCKYSPPTFIPLLFTHPVLNKDTITIINKANCLLFCYFNNRQAFDDYLRHFAGTVIVIIGPGEGTGVYTEPKPFDGIGMNWDLHACQEVRDSKDFIAVYQRSA